ncbi:MAG TPA: glycosyltransferase [Rhizomicrobium sp.]|jgi:glycosyltransferase involved in cell wall biosynthesis|nr:glycosyltransferase [Rhizomicrobium sp.]
MTARRILICLHDFARGGTERIAIGLAADWAQAGRDVTILCGSVEGGLRGTVSGKVKVVPLDPQVTRGFLSRPRLARAMGRHLAVVKPDVIFLPGNFHALLANGLRAADPRVVIALKISNPPLPRRAPFGAAIFRHITRAVDGFAAMNSGLAHELKAMLPGRDIVALHDPVYFRPTARMPRRGDRWRILWIGRLEPQKDPDLALQVMAAMDTPAHLTMLGDGALRASLRQRIAQLGLEGRVTLAGHVPETGSYLADADALLITSHYEGGPAVAVEALAQGVPVVSTDCSFLLHDIISVPEAGCIVTSRAARALAAALPAVCAEPRAPEMLQALAAPFEPQACARAYLDWLDGLVRHG